MIAAQKAAFNQNLGRVMHPFCQQGLGGVDKFEPVSGGGEMDHAEEAVGQLIVSGGNGPVDLQVTEHTLDAISLLV
jgi:uncharacterized protein GlcG (DUF336 family)